MISAAVGAPFGAALTVFRVHLPSGVIAQMESWGFYILNGFLMAVANTGYAISGLKRQIVAQSKRGQELLG